MLHHILHALSRYSVFDMLPRFLESLPLHIQDLSLDTGRDDIAKVFSEMPVSARHSMRCERLLVLCTNLVGEEGMAVATWIDSCPRGWNVFAADQSIEIAVAAAENTVVAVAVVETILPSFSAIPEMIFALSPHKYHTNRCVCYLLGHIGPIGRSARSLLCSPR